MKGLLLLGAMLASLGVTVFVSGRATGQTPVQVITVTVSCYTNPELVTVINATSSTIVLQNVGSVFEPEDAEPFTLNRAIPSGGNVMLHSHSAASPGAPNTLTRQELFDDHASSEGVRVLTNQGQLTVLCSAVSATLEVGIPTPTPTPSPTATTPPPPALTPVSATTAGTGQIRPPSTGDAALFTPR